MRKILFLLFFLLPSIAWAGFPANGVLDTFTRANSSTTLGSNWIENTNTWSDVLGISNNSAYDASDGANNGFGYWHISFSGNMEAYIEVSTANSGDSQMVGCFTDTVSGNGYLIGGNGTNATMGVYLLEGYGVVAFTQLFSTPNTINSGDSIGFRITPAGLITVYYEPGSGPWQTVGTTIDKTYQCAYIGFYEDSGGVFYKKFGGGNYYLPPVFTSKGHLTVKGGLTVK